VLGANYRVDAPLVGDAKLALSALDQALASIKRPLNAASVQKAKEEKFAKFYALAESDDRPIKPERVVAELTQALDADAIVVADAGTPCPILVGVLSRAKTGRRSFPTAPMGRSAIPCPPPSARISRGQKSKPFR
jgi:acetolactate synthase I/II/III large subunit